MSQFYALSKRLHVTVTLFIVFASFIFHAYSTGITGRTLKNGDGCTCHGSSAAGVTVTINGPASMQVNQTADFTVTISGGPLVKAGTNIAASSGTLIAGAGLQLLSSELTHISPMSPSGGTVSFSFQYKAPASAGTVTLYANGNSVNDNGSNDGDNWNFALNKTVNVTNVIPVELSSFTSSVSGNDVTLNWSTATETNNKGFFIEKQRVNNPASQGNQDKWESAGFTAGSGTSAEKHLYSFTDKNLDAGSYRYRLVQTDYDGSTRIYDLAGEVDITNISGFELAQNYPNPFNPSTTIRYTLSAAGNAVIKIYNIGGEEVALIFSGYQEAGEYSVNFDASGLPGGVYFYELNAGAVKSVKKMVLNK